VIRPARDHPEIVLPDPCLVVLIGPAGSGKTTLAARHFAPDEVLASDAFRARLGSGEDDQTASRRAFAALHEAVSRRLAAGRLTVVDATSVWRRARDGLLRRARRAAVPAVALVLDLPEADCLAGDRLRRGRHVDPGVIHEQWLALQAGLGSPGGLAAEGFASVHRLVARSEVDRVVIRRRPASRAPRARRGPNCEPSE
jgi:protein phosphatase